MSLRMDFTDTEDVAFYVKQCIFHQEYMRDRYPLDRSLISYVQLMFHNFVICFFEGGPAACAQVQDEWDHLFQELRQDKKVTKLYQDPKRESKLLMHILYNMSPDKIATILHNGAQ